MRNAQLSHARKAVVVFTVIAFAVALSGCRGKSEDAKLRLKPGQDGAAVTQAGQSQSGTASVDASGDVKAQTPAGQQNGTTGGSTSSGGTSSGGTSSGGSANGGGTTKPSADGMRVRIMFWNDTSTKKLSNTEVVFGSSSYKPSTSADSGTGIIGPCPYSKTLTLVIYPDGRNGKKIEVPFKVMTSMEAASERDAIHVSVSDDKVRVLGNAIDNFDQTYSRF